MPPFSILELNNLLKSQNATWLAKENSISQIPDEFRQRMLGAEEPLIRFLDESIAKLQDRIDAAMEPVVDWRNRNGINHVTPPKYQGSSGACVAFGTIGVVECMAHIKKNIWIDLSEADHIFCSSHGCNMNGWSEEKAFNQLKTRGVCDEASFPFSRAFPDNDVKYYFRKNSTLLPVCLINPGRDTRAVRISNFTNFKQNQRAVKEHLAKVGPVTGSMSIYKDFYSYSSGVYQHVTGDYVGHHCIMIVGYSEVEKCWICRNSWGTDWGMGGFFKIAYGNCRIDETDKIGVIDVSLPLFSQIANKQPLKGTSLFSPAICIHKSNIYLAWTDSTDNRIHVASSVNGIIFGTESILNEKAAGAPSIVSHNEKLYLAFTSASADKKIQVLSSSDGIYFESNIPMNASCTNTPILTSYNGNLLAYFTLSEPQQRLAVAKLVEEKSFTSGIPLSETSSSSPSVTILNGILYLGWTTADKLQKIAIMSTPDGETFSQKKVYSESSSSGVSLSNDGCVIWISGGNSPIFFMADPGLQKKITFPDSSMATPSFCYPFLAWSGTDREHQIVVAKIG